MKTERQRDYIWLQFFIALFLALASAGAVFEYGEEAKASAVIFCVTGWFLFMFGYVNVVAPLQRKIRKWAKKRTRRAGTHTSSTVIPFKNNTITIIDIKRGIVKCV